MKISLWIKRGVCVALAALTAASLAACGCSKKNTNKNVKSVSSNVGKVTSQGYELPYTYPDGYVAVAKIVDNSTYKTVETTGLANTRYWLTTTTPKAEVEEFYSDYFSTLQLVKAKLETDESVAYYDKEKRIIISNLTIWEADDGVNYKFGIEPCDDLSKSEIWEAKDSTGSAAASSAAASTAAESTTAATN